MDVHTKAIDLSQKVRYESFMKFASDASEARTLQAITAILESNFKYVVNTFIARFWAVVGGQQVVYELNRNQGSMITEGYEANSMELGAILKKLPVNFPKSEILNYSEWKDSIFNHDKVQHFCLMPIVFSPHQTLVISIAYKESIPYNQSDYRFLKLIGEFLLNKISELLLLTRIEEKNKELADKNAELDFLNNHINDVNKYLEHLVNQRTEELRLVNQELYTLFYRTSHDFRRPLSTISGLLHWAETTTQNAETHEIIDKCQAEIKQLYKMLYKLNKISLNEMGEEEDIEKIDFEAIMQFIYQNLTPELKTKNIQINHKITLSRGFWGNYELIQTVLENVIENAVHFADYLKSTRWIRTQIFDNAQKLIIQIEDNGIGIKPEHQKRVFDMYFRGSEESKGNGLGLYVSQKLVKNLHGEIKLTSKEGEGTCVNIQIPFRLE